MIPTDADWVIYMDTERPGRDTLITYKGVPVGMVMSFTVGAEPITSIDGKVNVASVLNLKINASSLQMTTFVKKPAAEVPAQAELPLDDKKT